MRTSKPTVSSTAVNQPLRRKLLLTGCLALSAIGLGKFHKPFQQSEQLEQADTGFTIINGWVIPSDYLK